MRPFYGFFYAHNSNESLFDDKTKQIVYILFGNTAAACWKSEVQTRTLYGLTVDNRE